MTRMRPARWRWLVVPLAALLVLAACGDDDDGDTAAPTTVAPDDTGDDDGAPADAEVDLDLLETALGTSDTSAIPPIILASIERAGRDISADQLEVALQCWRDKRCDTGTGGEVTVALADGFGENVWREVTHMEFVLQALTYPEIGEIIYTSAQGDTQKAISDMRSLIAQGVDVIATFPDAGEALLPTAREAKEQGVIVAPYIASLGGEAGEDYLTFVAEDLCQLGESFAALINEELSGSGNVVFLGGTPGNPLSEAWQTCEEDALANGINVLGRADTNWTREGTLEAMSGFLAGGDEIDAISYEYADGFLGGLRAYEAAGQPLDVLLTLRTDEVGLFCEAAELGNPDFRIWHSSGGGFDSRIALTAGMMALNGEDVPDRIVVPVELRQADDASCNADLPGAAPISTLVPDNVLAAMYP